MKKINKNKIAFFGLLASGFLAIVVANAVFQGKKLQNENNFSTLKNSNQKNSTGSYLVKLAKSASSGHFGAIWHNGVTDENELYMWGKNQFGQIGDGNTENVSKPKRIDVQPGKDHVVDISLGYYHSAAVVSSGYWNKLYTWGNNQYGQLGRTGNSKVPGMVDLIYSNSSDYTIRDVALGELHSAVLLEDNYGDIQSVFTWGFNEDGQLGYHTADPYWNILPKEIPGLSGYNEYYSNLVAGYNFTAIVSRSKKLYTWGSNEYGQLGRYGDNYLPQQVTYYPFSNTKIINVSAGSEHMGAIVDNNGTKELYTWGLNDSGQLGIGSHVNNVRQPTKVSGFGNDKLVKYSAGSSNSAAIVDNNKRKELYTWGENIYGQLGNKDSSFNGLFSPGKIKISGDVLDVAIASYAMFALTENRSEKQIYSWGYNAYKQLGRYTTNYSDSEPGLVDVLNISFYTVDTTSLNGLYYFQIYKELNDSTDSVKSLVSLFVGKNHEFKTSSVSLNGNRDKIIIKWQAKNLVGPSSSTGLPGYTYDWFINMPNIEIPINNTNKIKLGDLLSLIDNNSISVNINKFAKNVTDSDLTVAMKNSINAKIKGLISITGFAQTKTYSVDSKNANNKNGTVPIKVTIKGSIDPTSYVWNAERTTTFTVYLQLNKKATSATTVSGINSSATNLVSYLISSSSITSSMYQISGPNNENASIKIESVSLDSANTTLTVKYKGKKFYKWYSNDYIESTTDVEGSFYLSGFRTPKETKTTISDFVPDDINSKYAYQYTESQIKKAIASKYTNNTDDLFKIDETNIQIISLDPTNKNGTLKVEYKVKDRFFKKSNGIISPGTSNILTVNLSGFENLIGTTKVKGVNNATSKLISYQITKDTITKDMYSISGPSSDKSSIEIDSVSLDSANTTLTVNYRGKKFIKVEGNDYVESTTDVKGSFSLTGFKTPNLSKTKIVDFIPSDVGTNNAYQYTSDQMRKSIASKYTNNTDESFKLDYKNIKIIDIKPNNKNGTIKVKYKVENKYFKNINGVIKPGDSDELEIKLLGFVPIGDITIVEPNNSAMSNLISYEITKDTITNDMYTISGHNKTNAKIVIDSISFNEDNTVMTINYTGKDFFISVVDPNTKVEDIIKSPTDVTGSFEITGFKTPKETQTTIQSFTPSNVNQIYGYNYENKNIIKDITSKHTENTYNKFEITTNDIEVIDTIDNNITGRLEVKYKIINNKFFKKDDFGIIRPGSSNELSVVMSGFKKSAATLISIKKIDETKTRFIDYTKQKLLNRLKTNADQLFGFGNNNEFLDAWLETAEFSSTPTNEEQTLATVSLSLSRYINSNGKYIDTIANDKLPKKVFSFNISFKAVPSVYKNISEIKPIYITEIYRDFIYNANDVDKAQDFVSSREYLKEANKGEFDQFNYSNLKVELSKNTVFLQYSVKSTQTGIFTQNRSIVITEFKSILDGISIDSNGKLKFDKDFIHSLFPSDYKWTEDNENNNDLIKYQLEHVFGVDLIKKSNGDYKAVFLKNNETFLIKKPYSTFWDNLHWFVISIISVSILILLIVIVKIIKWKKRKEEVFF